jgi:hypothetical protein
MSTKTRDEPWLKTAGISATSGWIKKKKNILFHCSCNVQCCLFPWHHHTWFFLFSTKSSVFSQQFSCESHKLLNRLWIDLLQIGTGTDWLNSFIKSCKLLLRSCFTNLINVRSPWIYGFHKRIVAKKLTISLKIEKIMCDGVTEIDYTGHYKNNGIK